MSAPAKTVPPDRRWRDLPAGGRSRGDGYPVDGELVMINVFMHGVMTGVFVDGEWYLPSGRPLRDPVLQWRPKEAT